MHVCLYSRDADNILPCRKFPRENVNDIYRAQSNGQARPLVEQIVLVIYRKGCRMDWKSKYLF